MDVRDGARVNVKYGPEIRRWLQDTAMTPTGKGQCYSAAHHMAEVFPELNTVSGWAYCERGRVEHWWCETTEGDVVDPTAGQYEALIGYERYEPGMEIGIGKCRDCGSVIYGSELDPPQYTDFCDEGCMENTRRYLEAGSPY